MDEEIGVSLENVLQLPLLAGAKVIAGENGLKRLVTSVNVMEVPDILDWVSGGQLLMTTAYSLKNDITVLEKLVPKLEKANAAGLGIKPKRYIDEVPVGVIKVADQISFPIFEIPQDISFSQIITSVMVQVMNRQTSVLKEIHTLHQSLTSAMLQGGNLQEIGNILYQRFNNSVAINSNYFSSFVINTTPEKYHDINKILQNDKRSFTEKSPNTITACYSVAGDCLGGTVCNRIVVPIYSDKVLYGHIYIWEDICGISSLELSAIESVTSLIALNIMKRIALLKMENNHKSGFLEDLLSADSRRQQKAVGNARFYDFNPKMPHQVIVIRPQWRDKNFKSTGKDLFRVNTTVIGILHRLVKSTPFKILYVNLDSSIIILCEIPPTGPGGGEEELNLFLGNLSIQLEQEYLSEKITIGVGRRYDQHTSLYKSLSEARRATSCSHMAVKNVMFYEDLGVCRLLSFENLRHESELFCNEILKPLIDYDAEKDAKLLNTLTMYFKCRGNLTRLAEDMEVHYNTISYRLQRIRDLTGLSFDNDKDLLNMQIALKIREMRKNG